MSEFEPNRTDTEYVLSCSYGKDSIACIEACKRLGWRIDRIVTAQVWATQTIPADMPEMMSFKNYADEQIRERYGLKVEHYCADKCDFCKKPKVSYEDAFYTKRVRGQLAGNIHGFPPMLARWCNKLKMNAIAKCGTNGYSFIGIAADETERIERHSKKENVALPLVKIGWTESDCFKWCEENDLLAPTYKTSFRDGCWFCHCQSTQQLRNLYHNHPELWKILMKWDNDSPVAFKIDKTVHDYDTRFKMEDAGIVSASERWKWSYLHDPPERQMCLFDEVNNL